LKLHLSKFSEQNVFFGYGEDYVTVNQTRYTQNLIVLPNQLIENWSLQKTLGQLESSDFTCLLPHNPEIVLLGTGANLHFPDQSILKDLANNGIGIEIMDTQATCRTYNILVEEGRHVAAAILI